METNLFKTRHKKSGILETYEGAYNPEVSGERRVSPLKRLKFDLLRELSIYQGLFDYSTDEIVKAYYRGKLKGIQFAIDLLDVQLNQGKL
jgi:hypothetical protein